MTKRDVVAFFKKVWDVVKKVFYEVLHLINVIADLRIIANKATSLFGAVVIAVKNLGSVIECVWKNGKPLEYETNSQIVETKKIDREIFRQDDIYTYDN